MIINEQSQNVQGNKADITVNALHVMIPGIADVIIASAHADITCTGKTCPLDEDFVTGGGRINTASGKSTFAVAGGIKNGYWGHLSYIDHGTGMHVKATAVTGYSDDIDHSDPDCRIICYDVTVDGVPGYKARVRVCDKGEPGKDDVFEIKLYDSTVPPPPPCEEGAVDSPTYYSAGGDLGGVHPGGGNIQLHKCQ